MVTAGRSRPLRFGRVAAGLIARQLARIRASGATSAPCMTVVRSPGARKLPGRPNPIRRSRMRADGRTKRAAGRAAYLAAML
jgi:hypothetical protein